MIHKIHFLLPLLIALSISAQSVKLTRHHTDSSHLMKRIMQSETSIERDTETPTLPYTKRSDSRINMDIDSSGGLAYTIDILVGEGKVAVPVLVDTGGADLWVSANPCDNCTKANMVDSGVHTSDGCALRDKGYGSGSIHGCLVPTDITIGQYHLPNYPLLSARDVEGFDGKYMSGILGLATSKLSLDNKPTPIDLMMSGGMISSPEVGFYLTREGDGSEIIFGSPHLSSHADQSKKVQLPKQGEDGHYRVKLDAFVSHGQPIPSQKVNMQNIEVVLDTGSTNILVPQSMMEPLYATLGKFEKSKDDLLMRLCKGPDNPDEALGLVFGRMTFNIKWQDLIAMPVPDNEDFCYLRIQETPAEEFIIMGSAFLHNVYHVVNAETGEVTIYGLTD